MANGKNRVTVGNVLTALLVLFAAGTAWGISNASIEKNSERMGKIETDFQEFESLVDARLAKIQADTNSLNITVAEIANDVKWIKENQNK